MLQVNDLIGFGGSTPPATVTFTDVDTNGTSLITYTFTGKSIGAAAANRRVIVTAVTRDSGPGGADVSTLTVGSIAATRAVAQHTGAVAREIWITDVPTGTSADIVVTFTEATTRCAIGVFAAYDLISSTPTDTSTATGDPSTTTACDIQAGGIAVAMGMAGGIASMTWTGLTERFDALVEGTDFHGGAADAFAASQIGPTITCDFSAAGTDPGMVVAAWR